MNKIKDFFVKLNTLANSETQEQLKSFDNNYSRALMDSIYLLVSGIIVFVIEILKTIIEVIKEYSYNFLVDLLIIIKIIKITFKK